MADKGATPGLGAKPGAERRLNPGSDGRRCPWAEHDALLQRYHDTEWGVPTHDDRRLYEFLVLEAAQAGLSWRTVLARREAYREAFAGFDPEVVAAFGPDWLERTWSAGGVIRHRGKLMAAVRNARSLLALRERTGESFATFLWRFVGGVPRIGGYRTPSEVPSETLLSRSVAQALREAGFAFVGPVMVQSYLQAVGVCMDHLTGCDRFRALQIEGARVP